MSYKSWIGLNKEKNVIFKSQEWYYIVSIYKYYQVTLFLVLIQKFDQKSNFQTDWPELGLIRFD